MQVKADTCSSYRAIAGVALPAIVLNAAGPVTVAVQTALLGVGQGASAVAAFAAVVGTASLVTRLFNFLVDGVASKCGRSVGSQNWAELSSRVQLALSWSLGMGVLAAAVLAASKRPICAAILQLPPAVAEAAAPFWWLRIALLPVSLWNMACSGILQGFRHVRLASALASGAALLELAGSVAVLRFDVSLPGRTGLVALGMVTLAAQLLLGVAGLVCVSAMPPEQCPGLLTLAPAWLRRQQARQRSEERAEGISERLLPRGEGSLDAAPQDAEPVLLDFLRDGAAMCVRSLILQLTFFLALIAASRLGTEALAAHAVVGQLWVTVSYAVDGFAAAGIVLGSRLAAQAHDPLLAPGAKRSLQRLIRRVLLAGLASGVAAAAAFALQRDRIIGVFTGDAAVAATLGNTWWILVAAQPVNSLTFVYDGLMYASQHFGYVRNYMLAGFLLVFAPLLALQVFTLRTLWGVWLAKAALNVWRAGGAAYLVHVLFMREFDTLQP